MSAVLSLSLPVRGTIRASRAGAEGAASSAHGTEREPGRRERTHRKSDLRVGPRDICDIRSEGSHGCVQHCGRSPKAPEGLLCSAWKAESCGTDGLLWAALLWGNFFAFQGTGSPPTCARILMMTKLAALKNISDITPMQLLSYNFLNYYFLF